MMIARRCPAASQKAGINRPVRGPAPVVLRPLKAVENETETSAAPASGFDFTPSPRSAEGYVEKDSAGQSNLYPTVTRPFEAGSSADSAANAGYNTGVAVGAAVVSAGLVAVGLLALSGSGPSTDAQVASQNYLTLSEYKSKFSAELGIKAAAPVVPAPAVEVVEVVTPTEIVEVVVEAQ